MVRPNLAVAASFLALAAACRAPELPRTVVFRVVDEAGAPLCAARVQLREATREGAAPASTLDELSAWRSPWFEADGRGCVRVAIPESRGERRLVEVRARDFAPRWVWLADAELTRPAPRGVLELGDVALEKGGRIRGFVHTSGIAAASVWTVRARGVVLRDGDAVFYTGGANGQTEFGQFEILDVRAGEVELEASLPNGVYARGPVVTVERGRSVLASIALPDGLDSDANARRLRASVSVRLHGTPPPDLELRLRDRNDVVTGYVAVQPDGTLGPLGAEPGTYRCVIASRTDGWSLTRWEELTLGYREVRWLDFDCTTTRGVLALVRADDGAAVALERFAIRAREMLGVDRDPSWLRTDAEGRATVALPPGAYALTSIADSSSCAPRMLAAFHWPPVREPLRVELSLR